MSSLLRRSAVELAAAIRTGEVRAADVVEAHVEALEDAQPRTRAVVADRFDAARTEAAAADERVAAGGELPPLLGVPFTVKESIQLAGMPNTAGLRSRAGRPATGTASVVARLIEAGAIPLAVTNTPELCLWLECSNRVHGRTSNAYDPRRTAGGSSGGEGAAVGSGGAPFGIGTDIGGSIRLPAFFNGVFGHKATPFVVPVSGQFPQPEGEHLRLYATGPLARRAEDLMPVLTLIAGPDGEDETTRPATLGDPAQVELGALEVAVVARAGPARVQSDVAAGVTRAADALEAAGARVRRVRIAALRRVFDLYMTALAAGDAAASPLLDLLGGEGGPPARRRAVIASALRRGGDHTPAIALLVALDALPGSRSPRVVRAAASATQRLREAVLEEIGDGVLLYPPHVRVAPRHGHMFLAPAAHAYMSVFNLLELPVTQVPCGIGSRGLPLGVQVAGAPGADHVTIAAALELERALGGWVPPWEVSRASARAGRPSAGRARARGRAAAPLR